MSLQKNMSKVSKTEISIVLVKLNEKNGLARIV